jgi:hypothetical protein
MLLTPNEPTTVYVPAVGFSATSTSLSVGMWRAAK